MRPGWIAFLFALFLFPLLAEASFHRQPELGLHGDCHAALLSNEQKYIELIRRAYINGQLTLEDLERILLELNRGEIRNPFGLKALNSDWIGYKQGLQNILATRTLDSFRVQERFVPFFLSAQAAHAEKEKIAAEVRPLFWPHEAERISRPHGPVTGRYTSQSGRRFSSHVATDPKANGIELIDLSQPDKIILFPTTERPNPAQFASTPEGDELMIFKIPFRTDAGYTEFTKIEIIDLHTLRALPSVILDGAVQSPILPVRDTQKRLHIAYQGSSGWRSFNDAPVETGAQINSVLIQHTLSFDAIVAFASTQSEGVVIAQIDKGGYLHVMDMSSKKEQPLAAEPLPHSSGMIAAPSLFLRSSGLRQIAFSAIARNSQNDDSSVIVLTDVDAPTPSTVLEVASPPARSSVIHFVSDGVERVMFVNTKQELVIFDLLDPKRVFRLPLKKDSAAPQYVRFADGREQIVVEFDNETAFFNLFFNPPATGIRRP